MSVWDAIGIGLVVRDISVLMDHFPAPDEKISARELHESGGGPVPTALVTLARLGRKTAIAGLVGNDAVGRFIVEGLEKESVDTSTVTVHEGFESPTSVIVVENGRRTILEAPHEIGFPLAWDDVRGLPLDDCDALLVDARTVPVQIEAARHVRRAGGLVVLDCGHPREGVDELMKSTDIVIFSHTYPSALHGGDYDVAAFLNETTERLPKDGPAIVGVTLGGEGCAVASRDTPMVRVQAPAIDVLDTTGAGDVFHGAFTHAYLKTRSIPESARFANTAAAKKCEGMTGRAPIPSEEELWSAG